MYSSSMEGLYSIYGQRLSVISRDLFDSNIQSDFYPDSLNNIWFCSANGFYSYDPLTEKINAIRITDHNGDTLKSEYRIAGLLDENLFLYVGEELVRFNTHQLAITGRWCLGSCFECKFSLIQKNGNIQLYAGGNQGLETMFLEVNDEISERYTLVKDRVTAVQLHHGIVWAGDTQKRLYKCINGRIIREFPLSGIPISITTQSDDLILNLNESITFFNPNTESESTPLTFHTECESLANILDIEIDTDSILWISSDGDGVFTVDLHKPFQNFLKESTDLPPPNTTWIGPFHEHSMLLVSRNRGVCKASSDGIPDHVHNEISRIDSRRATIFHETLLYYHGTTGLSMISDVTRPPSVLRYGSKETIAPVFFQLHGADNLIGSTMQHGAGIISPNFETLTYSFTPFAIPIDNQKSYTYFQGLEDKRLLISYNEEEIHVFTPDPVKQYVQTDRIPITGGVWTVYEYPGDSLIYLGNSNGLYRIHEESLQFEALYDQEKNLPCQIYCMTGDTLQYLWISTNNGILRYHIPTRSSHRFTQRHGVTSSEFNSHAMYVDKDHNIYFGGTEGVTVFNPYEVKLSAKEAPVDVYGFKINDEETDTYGLPRNIETLRLPFTENTLSFEFQAIDYSDVTATRVKYRMSDYDKDWITAPDARGFARYANLRPGNYTLELIGLNADGVPGKQVKIIDITIVPPFYMTWWFRILVTVTVLGLGYVIVRAYYRRKLERKDLLLKQQSLLIEKQRAVEYERNRIATEMHDDLGAGLTRIKYLSERALRIAENEKESEQIKRIADQSNQLVTNMSEIIWAMNSRFDTAESLSGYIRRYASEYLEEHQMPVTFIVGTDGNVAITAEKRRNIFLVVKEALHNTIKYSKAQSVEIHMPMTSDAFEVTIVEKHSVGFDPDSAEQKGNGIHNMRRRMQTIDGTITFNRAGEDMIITIQTPLAS